jgi:hypothetical protein
MESQVTIRDVRIAGRIVAHMLYVGAECVAIQHCDPCPRDGAIPATVPDMHTHRSYDLVPGCPVCDLLVTDVTRGSDADRPYSSQAR